MPRAAPILAALALAAGLAPAQPTIGPDETAEAFITRWNEWAHETDPNQQLLADLQAASDTAWDAYLAVQERYQVFAPMPLEDVTAPGNWPAAQAAAEAIAPHTARIRELLASPHLALPFPGPEREAERRAQAAAAFESAPWRTDEGAIKIEQPPLPTTMLEMYFLGDSDGYQVRTSVTRLSSEWQYIHHIGNLGQAVSIILAYLDAYRLLAERGTPLDVLQAMGVESTATNAVLAMLNRHGRRARDGSLETLQSALLDHAQRRRPLSQSFWLDERVFVELLPAWFDPDQPDRLNERGRAYLDDLGISESLAEWADPNNRYTLSNPPPIDAQFAPASEQIRVYTAIAEAYARDAARKPHAIEELESARLFRSTLGADPDRRLAPALSRFFNHNISFELDLRYDIRLRATLTILAVHRHRARTGAWPESLADIDPAVMRFDPIDPHSGEPFGYAVIDDQPTLWSAGPDRKNDDARPIPQPPAPPEGEFPRRPHHRWFTLNEWNALPPEAQAEYDGDIILFPPPSDD
ncbi:MAG: hypothetical protein LAT64_11010 [Phycisphaerales bacterium]|nr:hypothetical protein [Planctomycetota bacterium]MCH8509280.1 hypothetical protein [Phycisphaerales bacterium]